MIHFTSDKKLIKRIVQNQEASYVALVELQDLLYDKKRRILQKKIDAQLKFKGVETAKWQKTIKERAARYSISDNETYERTFILNELLNRWNDLFERGSIDVVELQFVEYEGKTKRYVADNFSFELTGRENKLDNIRFLKLSYESEDKKLLFDFSAKDNAESVLYLEFKTEHEDRSISSEISGMPVDFTQGYGLCDFLCALEQPELAEKMTVFFNRLAGYYLPNKEDKPLKEKYASILQDLCRL